MSGHASVERMSLYLDKVLTSSERRRVEDHLDACPDCRQRLAGLRRVVAGLDRLPAAAAPTDLALRVRRGVALRGRRRGWSELLERHLPLASSNPPLIHLFALVLALGAIVYLFAYGVEMRRERSTRIVLPDAGSSLAESAPTARLDVEPPAAAASAAPRVAAEAPPRLAAGVPAQMRLLGGVFHRVGGVWVERGLAARPADDRVELRWPAPSELAADPELAALARLGAPLRLLVGERVVEIDVHSAAAR